MINKKPTKRSSIIVIICVILVGIALALFVPISPFALNKPKDSRPENTIDYNKATDDQKEAGDKAKEDFINKHDDPEGQPDQPPAPSNVALTITSVSQQDKVLQVRSMIETIDSKGTCKLTLSREGSNPVVQSAGVQQMGSYSVCQGFNVPTNELTKGQWNIRIDYTNENSSGVVEKKVDIQ